MLLVLLSCDKNIVAVITLIYIYNFIYIYIYYIYIIYIYNMRPIIKPFTTCVASNCHWMAVIMKFQKS